MADREKLFKLLAGVVAVLGAAAFFYAQYATTTAAIASPGPPGMAMGGGRPPGGMAPPSKAEREKMRDEMLTLLKLSDDQRAQFLAFEEKYGAPGDGPPPDAAGMAERMAALDKILTVAQRDQMTTFMQARMKDRMLRDARRLPAAEQAKFKEKLDKRLASGDLGPPGGPPPEGAPPP